MNYLVLKMANDYRKIHFLKYYSLTLETKDAISQIDQFEDINDDMEFVEKLITEQSVFPLPANVSPKFVIFFGKIF